jgi:hypothetical protein
MQIRGSTGGGLQDLIYLYKQVRQCRIRASSGGNCNLVAGAPVSCVYAIPHEFYDQYMYMAHWQSTKFTICSSKSISKYMEIKEAGIGTSATIHFQILQLLHIMPKWSYYNCFTSVACPPQPQQMRPPRQFRVAALQTRRRTLVVRISRYPREMRYTERVMFNANEWRRTKRD